MDPTFFEGYTIKHKLGSGGYGDIFSVKSRNEKKLYALKTEHLDSPNRVMKNEIRMLKQLPDLPIFPKIIKSGKTSGLNYFVMPLYGPSLSIIRHNLEGGSFSLPTLLYVAKETFTIIEILHQQGIVHCDVKPSNFLLNQVEYGGLVLIDFGLSSKFIDSNHNHITNQNSNGFRGTMKYASINVHKMIEPTRRDDIISWFYSIIELFKGKLPWKDVQDSNLSMSCKASISIEKLCSGLPRQMKIIWEKIKDLEFDEEPDYNGIRIELDEAISENGINLPFELDWESHNQIIKQLSPHPELFDKECYQNYMSKESNKKKSCFIY
ncbi:CK1 family protein kinase [Tritrichomonas foetus]|uniref:non-specific serine/threonine protein kinase n=1 Tax=Tritrichomonas foetus TaxID=1144522 RepID=A0A1J4JJV4_9EUKA|nr:CK1 family protein kinase [Tritrichomonas foetus]|eukprot:OHS97837.1 CK1 family protein kinase [Tritrichomonas foetus]